MSSQPNKLCLVIPCYNEESILHDTIQQLLSLLQDLITKGLAGQDSCMLLVNDGSSDKTWDIIENASKEHPGKVLGASLAANRGHQAALLAGLTEASEISDVTVSLDADLQDDMRVIVEGDANRDPYLTDVEMTIKSDHLTEFAADLGLYFNLPLSNRFALGTKLLIGRSIMQEIDLNAKAKGGVWTYDIDDNFIAQNIQYHGEYETEWDYFMVSANNTMKYGTGLSLTYAYKENFAWKLFFDYDFARKTYTLDYNPLGYVPSAFPLFREFMQTAPEFFTNSQSVKKNRHTFILGGSFVVSF